MNIITGIQLTREDFKEIIREVIKEELQTPNESGNTKIYLTIKETANLLNVSVGTVHNLKKQGKLKYSTLNRRVAIKRTDVEEFINKNRSII